MSNHYRYTGDGEFYYKTERIDNGDVVELSEDTAEEFDDLFQPAAGVSSSDVRSQSDGSAERADADEFRTGGETERATSDAPFDPDDYSVSGLREELDRRDPSDEELDALEDAERSDPDPRSTALDAIDDQRED